MAEQSAISWTDATFNPWIGCRRISPACDHCYAARDNERRKWVRGADGKAAWDGPERKRTKTWGAPLLWNRKAAASGIPLKVFCASLADVFDNEAPDEWRADLWALIDQTPNLRWILLTKRIGNAAKMLPPDWLRAPRPHVGFMATLVTQEEWDRDYPKLAQLPARWRGVSAEPLLGRIDIGVLRREKRLDWIITGGESGPGFRPLDLDAVRFMRDQCAAYGITFHHKQNGGLRGKDAGCLVDGVEHKYFPQALVA